MFRIEPISPDHNTKRFDCGEPTLNRFLSQFALKNARNDIGRTYVAVRPNETDVLAYYTLSAGSVRFDQLPSDLKLPKYPIPTVHIGRLATDLSVRGLGLGEAMLFDALKTAEAASDAIGIRVVELIALNQAAKDFYLRYGFVEMLDDPYRLYMSMETVRKALI